MAESPPPTTSADDAIGDLLEALWHRLEEALDRSTAADADLGRVASLCREAACLADAAVILAGRPPEPTS
jgi:hypothetical protein